MMMKAALAVVLASIAPFASAEARITHHPRILEVHRKAGFLGVLDHNGTMSAEWINILPALATTCNLRIDNGELTSRLIDLSYQTGNISYTRDLYTKLYMLETHRAKNTFVRAWSARFDGRQKEACDTAQALWGESGHQFPGVLKRDAMNDGIGGAGPATAPNSK
jgi:hypothetical protein